MNCNTIYWVKTYHYKVYVMGSLFLKGKAYHPACDILKYICMTPRSCDMHDLRCQCWAHVVDHQGMLAETKHEFYSKDECPTIYIHLWVWTTIKLHTLQFVGVAHQKWEIIMPAQFPNMNDATPWWRVMLLEQFWINRDSSCIVVRYERLVVGSAHVGTCGAHRFVLHVQNYRYSVHRVYVWVLIMKESHGIGPSII